MYTEECIKTFLKNQGQLFDEPVAETYEEAEEFLEDCMAVVADSIEDVRKYLSGMGADVEGMSKEELEKLIGSITKKMKKAAAELNFELAAELRDKLIKLKKAFNEIED